MWERWVCLRKWTDHGVMLKVVTNDMWLQLWNMVDIWCCLSRWTAEEQRRQRGEKHELVTLPRPDSVSWVCFGPGGAWGMKPASLWFQALVANLVLTWFRARTMRRVDMRGDMSDMGDMADDGQARRAGLVRVSLRPHWADSKCSIILLSLWKASISLCNNVDDRIWYFGKNIRCGRQASLFLPLSRRNHLLRNSPFSVNL